MANTTNLGLGKLAGTEKLKTFPSVQAGNMDTIDAAFGAGFGKSSKPSVDTSLANLADGLAIIANGNTHAAITSGQYVYVRNHGTLSEGLYKATSNISANATLSGSNLTADSNGGLNDVFSTLNGKIEKYQGTRIWISGVNCDNYTNEGLYMLSDSLTNAPLTWFMLIVIAPRNDAITQIAIKSPSLIYVRNYTSGWSSWEKVSLKSDIKQGNFTGTTSANGNTSKQFSSKVIILSAWSSHDSYIVKQYPGAGADADGQFTWWFHVCSDNANMIPVTNESVAIYYTYIEE